MRAAGSGLALGLAMAMILGGSSDAGTADLGYLIQVMVLMTLLHLDGSENRLPARGADVLLGERPVGFVGTSARHHELGPIALALLKRNVAVDDQLDVDGLPAAQEVIVDPEVGLHVRPLR